MIKHKQQITTHKQNNDNIHKRHAPNIQGCSFVEGAKAPQAATTQPQRAWGCPEIIKHDNIRKIHTQQHPGLFFLSEGAEAAQAAATQTQRAGNPEIDNDCRLSQGNLDS